MMDVLGMSPQRASALLLDLVLTVCLYRSLPNRANGIRSNLLRCAPLLLLYPLMMQPTPISWNVLRYLWRWGCMFLYLLARKRLGPEEMLYASGLGVIAFTAMQNLIIIAEFFLQGLPAGSKLHLVLLIWIEYILPLLIFLALSYLIPFSRLTADLKRHCPLLILLSVVVLYVKQSFFLYTRQTSYIPVHIITYPLVISALVFILIGFFDRYSILQKELQRQQMLDLAAQYRYQDLQNQLSAQDEVRRIYHDMKNHLLAIESLSSSKQRQYIGGVLKQMEDYSRRIQTGNATLDGLINHKRDDADRHHIRLDVRVDLSMLSFLDPIHICAIFGNALDNALEAASQVPDEEQRFILWKSGIYANQAVILITNSCNAPGPIGPHGWPKTTKADARHHGLGLDSIRRSLAYYHGIATCEQTAHQFSLKLMIPLQSTPEPD